MESQLPKKAHNFLKKKNLFQFFQKFQKIYTNGHLTPATKLHNVLTVRTKTPKSNHISYKIVKPTPTYKYIQSTPPKHKTKPKQNQNQKQNKTTKVKQKETLINIYKTYKITTNFGKLRTPTLLEALGPD